MKLAMDFQKCTGCGICELACSATHQGVFNPQKAHLRIIDEYTHTGREMQFKSCTLCLKCVENCPSEAIVFTGDWLHVDLDLCTGCGSCVDDCPEGVIFLTSQGAAAVPDFCEGHPQCVEWCPHGAIRKKEDET